MNSLCELIFRLCGARLFSHVLLLAVAFLLTAAPLVSADPLREYRPPEHGQGFNKAHRSTLKKQQDKRRLLSMSEAIAIAERRNNGQVLSARQTVNTDGEPVYIIKVVTDNGVVRTVRINARQ